MSREVITRIGISPFANEQHIGVYRSFLVSVFLSSYFGGETFLRIDNTNPCHLADIDTLIDDMTQIVNPVSFAHISDRGVGVARVGSESVPAIVESERSDLYRSFFPALQERGFLFYENNAFYFDTRRYIDLFGDHINLPYQGKPHRTGLITKSLPELYFPIAVDGGRRFLWHFTSVIDDKILGVTHVVRAKDKIDNQMPQTMLNHALGFPLPQYFYTKIMLGSKPLPTVNDLVAMGVSVQAIRSYLYGTIASKPEKIYLSFEEALADFSPNSITPGQFNFDFKKVLFIHKYLSKRQ